MSITGAILLTVFLPHAYAFGIAEIGIRAIRYIAKSSIKKEMERAALIGTGIDITQFIAEATGEGNENRSRKSFVSDILNDSSVKSPSETPIAPYLKEAFKKLEEERKSASSADEPISGPPVWLLITLLSILILLLVRRKVKRRREENTKLTL